MSPKSALQIDIVRSEDKEAKLKTFITTFIEEADAHAAGSQDDRVLLLVLRSMESPAAKAVAALVRDKVLDRPIKAIFAMIENAELDSAGNEISPFVSDNSVRLARDPRLLDVHEQIVLGPSASWIGDCMRRDPRKRDAYECYAADCARTASWARISFERLWEKSVPGSASLPAAVAAMAGASPAVQRETATG